MDTSRTMDAPEASAPSWFTSDGTPYGGEVFQDDKGRPFGEVTVTCSKCGGSGRWKRRLACIRCDGEGEKFDQARLYTARQVETKDRAKQRRMAEVVAAQAAKEAGREAAYAKFMVDEASLLARAEGVDDRFVRDVLSKARTWGGLTQKQRDALVRTLDKVDDERATYANSVAVGSVGDRIEIEVTCKGRGSFLAKKFKGRGMREVFVTEMVDVDGNSFVAVTDTFKLDPGDRAVLRGTVKEHDTTRKAWTRTVVGRVSVLSLDKAAVSSADEPEAGAEVAPPL